MYTPPLSSAVPSIVFIGGGNMAGALIGGWVRSGRPAAALQVVEPAPQARDQLLSTWGVGGVAHAAEAALECAQVVVWAVKPQVFAAAAAACAGRAAPALHLSVMAGVRSAAIARATGAQRVVRCMPNTPALIGRGIAGLHATTAVAADDRARVEQLLAPTGELLWLDREADLDAVTALSGSGPAYVFYVVEALIEAAVVMGLTEAQGRQLALATFDGATALARQSSESPAVLRERVTSKGGTTHAAIESLRADGVHLTLQRAVLAACQRARELGDELER